MADNKIRVGIIGANVNYGWGTRAHVPALKALPQFELKAVCTTHQDTADETAKQFGIPLAFSDPGALVKHPEIDLVSVCVRVPSHHDLVMAALDAGKHVFCEWPLGANIDQASRMAELAERKGVRHMVGLQARGAPAVSRARDLVAQGYVGEVLSCTMIVSTPNWGGTLQEAGAWLADRTKGATPLSIPGGHSIDALCYCLGDFREVSAVSATRRKNPVIAETGKRIEMTAADQIVIAGVLASGALASIHITAGTANGTAFLLEIHGTEGDLVIAPTNPRQRTGVQIGEMVLRGAPRQERQLSDLPIPDSYRWSGSSVPSGPPFNVAQLFAKLNESIQQAKPASPDFADAVRLHRLLDTIEQAAASGQRQTL